MKKVKIFVSVPMKGRTEEEIREQIEKAYKETCDHRRIKYFNMGEPEMSDTYELLNIANLKYRKDRIKLLLDADIIVMGKGYFNDVDCMFELNCANHLGISVKFYYY